MKGFITFTKKEFMEQIRSYKALILIAVLFLFGMLSPLLAKLMPDIMSQMAVQGITFNMPKPTAFDAWSQFFKNMSQMGLIVMLLVFGGTLSQELSKGTLILPLSKGLPRHSVILSKFVSSIIIWTVCFSFSALTACAYTSFLFNKSFLPYLFFSLFCYWLFGLFLISLMLLSATIVPGNYGGLIMTAAFAALLLILNISPKIHKWNPISLSSEVVSLLNKSKPISDFSSAIWVTFILTVACITVSILVFRKKKV